MTNKIVEQKAFLKRDDKSDKIYVLHLLDAGNDRFLVHYAFGKRYAGPTGQNRGYKTEGKDSDYPVFLTEEAAHKIFDKTVRTREKHGYVIFENWNELEVFNILAYE